jgi:hypothetical protein
VLRAGIKDYHALINEIGRILRPRGMVLLQEWDYQTYDADKHIISPRSDGERPQESWFVRWVDTVREAVMARGGDLKSVPLLEGWIESHGAFEEIGRCDMWLPLAPYFPGHDESERILNEVGKSFRLDVHVRAFLSNSPGHQSRRCLSNRNLSKDLALPFPRMGLRRCSYKSLSREHELTLTAPSILCTSEYGASGLVLGNLFLKMDTAKSRRPRARDNVWLRSSTMYNPS